MAALAAWHLLVHALGVDQGYAYGTWDWYNFWSGSGSDLSYLGVLAALWHKHQCHEDGCWRLGRHVVEGTPWCDVHHGFARDGGPAFKKLRDKTPLPPA